MKQFNFLFNICRWLLVLLFIYTGVSKFIGHYRFLEQLSQVPLLQPIAGFISFFIPAAEIVAGILLVWDKTAITGWWISCILLSSFSIYIAGMLLYAAALPCSCGGIIASLSWHQHLIINISLTLICWLKLYHHYFILQFSMHTRE